MHLPCTTWMNRPRPLIFQKLYSLFIYLVMSHHSVLYYSACVKKYWILNHTVPGRQLFSPPLFCQRKRSFVCSGFVCMHVCVCMSVCVNVSCLPACLPCTHAYRSSSSFNRTIWYSLFLFMWFRWRFQEGRAVRGFGRGVTVSRPLLRSERETLVKRKPPMDGWGAA